jgi:hypothetical protein
MGRVLVGSHTLRESPRDGRLSCARQEVVNRDDLREFATVTSQLKLQPALFAARVWGFHDYERYDYARPIYSAWAMNCSPKFAQTNALDGGRQRGESPGMRREEGVGK